MSKKTIILLCLFLTGCVVPLYNIDSITYPRAAFKFQEKNNIGHTNPEKRMEAFIVCGLPMEKYTDGLGYIYGAREGESWEDVRVRMQKFEQCMEEKGYIFLKDSECGSKKESRGICK